MVILTPKRLQVCLNLRGATLLTITALAITRSQLLAPIRLLNTSLHESGHVVAVYLTGGELIQTQIGLSSDSFVQSRGGMESLVLTAGYSTVFCWASAFVFVCRRGKNNRSPTTVFAGSCALACLLLPSLFPILLPWVLSVGAAAYLLQHPQFRILAECLAYSVVVTGLTGMYGDLDTHAGSDAHRLAARTGLSAVHLSLAWGLAGTALFTLAYGATSPQAEPRAA